MDAQDGVALKSFSNVEVWISKSFVLEPNFWSLKLRLYPFDVDAGRLLFIIIC